MINCSTGSPFQLSLRTDVVKCTCYYSELKKNYNVSGMASSPDDVVIYGEISVK